jgi:hypothetical protein
MYTPEANHSLAGLHNVHPGSQPQHQYHDKNEDVPSPLAAGKPFEKVPDVFTELFQLFVIGRSTVKRQSLTSLFKVQKSTITIKISITEIFMHQINS